MYINKKELENKRVSLREQLNADIKGIARKRLINKDLNATARQILEEIIEGKAGSHGRFT